MGDELNTDPMGTDDFDTIADSGDETVEPSPITLDYYRGKAMQFQAVLNGLDTVYFDLQQVAALAQSLNDGGALSAEVSLLLDEFESKRSQFTGAAQALNLASDGLNAVGIEFPQVQIGGIAGVPLAAIAAVGATVVVATALISWATGFFRAVQTVSRKAANLITAMQIPEADRAQFLATTNKADNDAEIAIAQAQGSPLAGAATLIKWVVIGGIAYLAYKTFMESKR